jgi:hypothetical protein
MKFKLLLSFIGATCLLTSLACAGTVKTDRKVYVNYSSDGYYPSEGNAWVDGNYPTAPQYTDGTGQTFSFWTWYYYWGGWGYGGTDQAWAGVPLSSVSSSEGDHNVTLDLVPSYKGDCDKKEVYGSKITIPQATYTVAYVSVSGPQSLNWIWYFDGAVPLNYPVINTAWVKIQPDAITTYSGITWSAGGPVTATQQFGNSWNADVKSKGKSASTNDSQAIVAGYVGGMTYGSWVTASGTCTVDYVKDVTQKTSYPEYHDIGTPWYQYTNFKCNSKFGSTMVKSLELNETWDGSHRHINPNCDWSHPAQPAYGAIMVANNWMDTVSPDAKGTIPDPYERGVSFPADEYDGQWQAGSTVNGNGTTAFKATWHRDSRSATYK